MQEIADLLQAGASHRATTYGPMAEVVYDSLQEVTDEEALAMAVYLKALPRSAAAAAPAARAGRAGPRALRTGRATCLAPCVTCHGSVDQKLGAPWLEGRPQAYLVAQSTRFQAGTRRNDSHAQMRNMARTMSADEISRVKDFYARRGAGDARP